MRKWISRTTLERCVVCHWPVRFMPQNMFIFVQLLCESATIGKFALSSESYSKGTIAVHTLIAKVTVFTSFVFVLERDNRGKQTVRFSFLYVVFTINSRPHWKLVEKTHAVQLTNRSSCALHMKCCQIGNYYYMIVWGKKWFWAASDHLANFLFHLASFPQENLRLYSKESANTDLLLRWMG